MCLSGCKCIASDGFFTSPLLFCSLALFIPYIYLFYVMPGYPLLSLSLSFRIFILACIYMKFTGFQASDVYLFATVSTFFAIAISFVFIMLLHANAIFFALPNSFLSLSVTFFCWCCYFSSVFSSLVAFISNPTSFFGYSFE